VGAVPEVQQVRATPHVRPGPCPSRFIDEGCAHAVVNTARSARRGVCSRECGLFQVHLLVRSDLRLRRLCPKLTYLTLWEAVGKTYCAYGDGCRSLDPRHLLESHSGGLPRTARNGGRVIGYHQTSPELGAAIMHRCDSACTGGF
jgi:hypothetical protein